MEIGQHDATGWSQRLQASGEVWCIANHQFLARPAIPEEIADNHRAGCDADTRSKCLAAEGGQLGYRRRHRKGRANRALSLVLMRPRPTEIGEDAVAQELRDVAANPRDLACGRILIAAQQLAHVLGVVASRERG